MYILVLTVVDGELGFGAVSCFEAKRGWGEGAGKEDTVKSQVWYLVSGLEHVKYLCFKGVPGCVLGLKS